MITELMGLGLLAITQAWIAVLLWAWRIDISTYGGHRNRRLRVNSILFGLLLLNVAVTLVRFGGVLGGVR